MIKNKKMCIYAEEHIDVSIYYDRKLLFISYVYVYNKHTYMYMFIHL